MCMFLAKCFSTFPGLCWLALTMYQVDHPSYDDRLRYFSILFESLLSFQTEESRNKSKKQKSAIDLPKAPKEVEGPKVSELKAKAEAEQHAVRRMRMCLRDICNRILYNKRFNVFHFPVSEEEPMDMATVLKRVDSGQYLTRAAFMKDIDLIVSNAKTYNGDDYNGSRIVSRACELRDVVSCLFSLSPILCSRQCLYRLSFLCLMNLFLARSKGGPQQVVDDEDNSILQAAPVAQLVSGTRLSARLRSVQPEVNVSQSYEVLKRQKKSAENEHSMTKDVVARDGKSPEDVDLSKPTDPEEAAKEPESNGTTKEANDSPAEEPEVPTSPEPMESDNAISHAFPLLKFLPLSHLPIAGKKVNGAAVSRKL
ncbi:unnamed protein product [Miscanthus lutarioriparius]|uniref:Bromo domain-containing protein n=1 Tax=Miscanthus lutarioriparius TaxID=422564 RepID=A0A811NIJ3_9POAL|nr:unnamed protein product [Miscanthus lutarioriparius]